MQTRRWPLIVWTFVASLSLLLPAFVLAGPKMIDRDGDYLEDRFERRRFGTSSLRRDTDRDGILDGDEDADGDGVRNKDEFERGDPDRDGDGLADENERQWGGNPRVKDTDGDGILDGNDNDGLLPNFEDRDDRAGEGPRAEDKDDLATPLPTRVPTSGGGATPGAPTPTRIPAPTSTPRATRTATPTVSVALCFDSNGDTLAGCFSIPDGLSGNRFRGQSSWAATCRSCHTNERSGASFVRISNALRTVSSMSNLNLDNSVVADLAAYLNRPN